MFGLTLSRKNDSESGLQLDMLGIPAAEMTPRVALAVSALLEKIEDLSTELSKTKDHLTELEQLVDVDVLAPIPNRRAFMRRLSWAMRMHARYGDKVTILFFDINNFKMINDTYGHAAGDQAIRHFSALLRDCVRESDFIGRLGGDEFGVVLYHSDFANSEARGEIIREKLKSTPFVWNDKKIYMTSAFGTYEVKIGDDVEKAMAMADTAMYIDKRRYKENVLRGEDLTA